MNNSPSNEHISEGNPDVFARSALLSMNARAAVVNRTHRVVRERARELAARRSRVRSLWAPLIVFSALLVIICTAVWSVLDEYEPAPIGVPDASNQFLVLFLWFLPATIVLFSMVLFRRVRKRVDREAVQ
jgi:heme/copper-type cytochrome/quinol oxidase subunit 2